MKSFFKKYKIEVGLFIFTFLAQGIVLLLMVAYRSGADRFIWLSDSESYLRLAENLINYHTFTVNPEWGPTAFRTPLYPLFIAALFKIFSSQILVVAVQNIMAAFTVSLVFYFGKIFFGRKAAFLASVLFGLESARLILTNQLMSETLFLIFFIPATFYFLIFLFRQGAWWQLMLASLFLGLATLARPITQFFPFFLFLFFIFTGLWRKNYKRFFTGAILIVLIHSAVVAPWIIRNKIVFNELKLSPLGGIQLYLVNLPHYLEDQARSRGEHREYYQDLLNKLETDLNLKINYDDWTFESLRLMEFRYEPYFNSEFIKMVSQNPFGYLWAHFKRSFIFLIESGASQHYGAALAKANAIPQFVFYPLLFWGGRLLWLLFLATIIFNGFINWRKILSKNKGFYLFVILAILYFPAISAMNWMAPRFRLSINHLILLLFASAAVSLYNRLRARKDLTKV